MVFFVDISHFHRFRIHFDDQMSGHTVRDNTFVDSWVGIMLGGGRRTIIVNNTFERVDRAIEFDNR